MGTEICSAESERYSILSKVTNRIYPSNSPYYGFIEFWRIGNESIGNARGNDDTKGTIYFKHIMTDAHMNSQEWGSTKQKSGVSGYKPPSLTQKISSVDSCSQIKNKCSLTVPH